MKEIKSELTIGWKDTKMLMARLTIKIFNEHIKNYKDKIKLSNALKVDGSTMVCDILILGEYSEHCTLLQSFLEKLKIYYDFKLIEISFIKNLIGSEGYDILEQSLSFYYENFIYNKNKERYQELIEFYKTIKEY